MGNDRMCQPACVMSHCECLPYSLYKVTDVRCRQFVCTTDPLGPSDIYIHVTDSSSLPTLSSFCFHNLITVNPETRKSHIQG